MKRRGISIFLASSMLAGANHAAFAQGSTDEANRQVEEIIVTATKREQSTKDIASSITALGGEALAARRIEGLKDLHATVPGLQLSSSNASSNSVFLRGVGHKLVSPAAENSVALHLDGIYLANPAGVQAAFFDVQRVEVLRGPQGSLYGRNATGGAINIVSNEPTSKLSGWVSGTLANYMRTDIEGAVGGPLAGDALTARVGAFWHRRRDGFGKNLVTGTEVDDLNEWGGKASVKFEAPDTSSITIRGDYYEADDHFGGFHYYGPARAPFPGALPLAEMLGGKATTDIRDMNTNVPNTRQAKIWGVAGVGKLVLSDQLSLRSLTGYRKVYTRVTTDLDGTQLPIFDPFDLSVRSNQFSQELQLHLETEKLYLIVGGYYLKSKVRSDIFIDTYMARGLPAFNIPRLLPAPFGVFKQIALVKTEAEAAFANAEYKATDRLTLTGGLRYSHESKSNEGYNIAFFPNFASYPGVGYETVNDSRSSKGVTPSFSARYAITDDVNIYATVSRGFKSGEWIGGTRQYARPEFVWTYEAGIKGSLANRRVQFSLSGFHYDFKDLQVQRVQTPITILENAPGGKFWGVEGEFKAKLPGGFSIDGNFNYLDTKIVGFITQDPNYQTVTAAGVVYATRDLTGSRVPFAPKFTFNAGVEKQIGFGSAGEGTLRVDVQHSSLVYLEVFNGPAAEQQPAYTILNANYRHDFNNQFSVSIWGKNLTDKLVRENATINAIPNLLIPTSPLVTTRPYPAAQSAMTSLNQPRTFGITARYQW